MAEEALAQKKAKSAIGGPKAISRDRGRTTKLLKSVRRRAKKQGVLLQEVDAGCACLACNDCPGFELHVWRKRCRFCYCERNDHDITMTDTTVLPGQVSIPFDEDDSTKDQEARAWMQSELYAFIPSGLTKQQIERYMAMVPKDSVFENNEDGRKRHQRRILKQMPLHDAEGDACNELSTEETKKLNEFAGQREKESGQGTVVEVMADKHRGACNGCQREVGVRELVVLAEHLPGKQWHPQCFVCATCQEQLVNLCYFVKDGNIYCGRHYAEEHLPRCAGCDELILTEHHTKAKGRRWHIDHFCCFRCDRPMLRDKVQEEYAEHKGEIFCMECYGKHIANPCDVCKSPISAGEEKLSSGNHHWHMSCFNCSSCDSKLNPEKFLLIEEDKLICHSCYSDKFAKNCTACNKPITDQSLGAGGNHWHPECFVCTECKESLIGKSFVFPPEGIRCVPCHKKKSERACKACGEQMDSGGLVYKDECYHEKCFVCSLCSTALQTSPFVFKENAFFCQTCYEKKFSRQCHGCQKPITKRDGKGTYVSVKETAWHDDCFRCTNCQTVLGDDSFSFSSGKLTCRPSCMAAR